MRGSYRVPCPGWMDCTDVTPLLHITPRYICILHFWTQCLRPVQSEGCDGNLLAMQHPAHRCGSSRGGINGVAALQREITLFRR